MKKWENGYLSIQEEKINNSCLHAFSVYYNGEFVGQVAPQDPEDQEQIIKALEAGADPIAEGWEDAGGNVLEYPVEV